MKYKLTNYALGYMLATFIIIIPGSKKRKLVQSTHTKNNNYNLNMIEYPNTQQDNICFKS